MQSLQLLQKVVNKVICASIMNAIRHDIIAHLHTKYKIQKENMPKKFYF